MVLGITLNVEYVCEQIGFGIDILNCKLHYVFVELDSNRRHSVLEWHSDDTESA